MSNVSWLMNPVYNSSKIFGNIIILFAFKLAREGPMSWLQGRCRAGRWFFFCQMLQLFLWYDLWRIRQVHRIQGLALPRHTFRLQIELKIENSTQDCDWSFIWAINESAGSEISGICQQVIEPAQNIVTSFLLQSSTSMRYAMGHNIMYIYANILHRRLSS